MFVSKFKVSLIVLEIYAKNSRNKATILEEKNNLSKLARWTDKQTGGHRYIYILTFES